MADKRRNGKPYVWVTWITGLLAGSSRCEWSAWYKAHFRYEKKIDEDFDLDEWTAEHDRMVWARAKELRDKGATVNVEGDNAFTLKGSTAILGGKPDLVAYEGRADIFVDDCKTGKERDSDVWQVRTYLFALPKVALDVGRKWRGRLVYRGGRIVDVAPPTPPEVAKIGTVMQTIGGDMEPPRVPSREECSRCDILACPDRDDSKPLEGETTAF